MYAIAACLVHQTGMSYNTSAGASLSSMQGAESGGADKDFAQRHPLNILIADDNYINRRVLSMLLQRLGYEVEATENARDCLVAVMERSFDLLLIDINMPDISGIECTQQIRAAGRFLPIVAVTATSPDENRAQCFAVGMTGYMSKPIQLAELKQTLLGASRAKERNPASSVSR
jgi:CheY-like chemotaxis protein